MTAILGVDGGSSKTHALVVEPQGRVLGFGIGGPGNHQTSGAIAACAEIEQAVRGALQQDGLPPGEVQLGCFCLAGADLPQDYSMLQAAVEGLHLVRKVSIKNDTFAALRAGLTRSWGATLICGTGIRTGFYLVTQAQLVVMH